MAGHSIWLLAGLHCIVLHLHFYSYATILICTCSQPTVRFWGARPKQPCQLTKSVFQRFVLVPFSSILWKSQLRPQHWYEDPIYIRNTKPCNEGLCVCVAPAVTRLIQQIVAPHNPAVSYILWDWGTRSINNTQGKWQESDCGASMQGY